MNLTPFSAVAAPLRATHRDLLRSLASWSLAHGRSCDLDQAALTLDVLQRCHGDQPRLTRMQVNHLISCDLRNEASIARTSLPDDDMQHVWTVLAFLHDQGHLASDADPIEALLEPLQCYGGLGADGQPRPEGVDVDFACQCWYAYDPKCPPGQGLLRIGRHPSDHREFVVQAHLQPRSDDPSVSSYRPLIRFVRRLRAARDHVEVYVDDFQWRGRIDAGDGHPELWAYAFEPAARRGFDPLVLDQGGRAWRARPDGRRRVGFRWERLDDRSATWACGSFGHAVARNRPLLELVADPDNESWPTGTG